MFKLKNLFKKGQKNTSNAPKWNDLSLKQKIAFTRNVKKIMNFESGARYRIVDSSDVHQRAQGYTETQDEDDILSFHKRGQLLDLVRNAQRNNSSFNTILKQFDLQAIGNDGGKVILSLPDEEYNKKVLKEFSKWTRNSEFFDGLNLNTLIKIVFRTEITNGDCVLVFDDGLVNDSGKILLYESDEIGNTTDEALKQNYGKDSSQRLGRVYSEYGQFTGVIVSKNQRGKEVFDPSCSYFLKKDPNGDYFEDMWLMPRNIFRIGQGRGITPVTSSLSTLIDLENYVGFELAAAKKNAQTIATIEKTQKDEVVDLPSTFESTTDISKMSDEDIEKLVQEENNGTVEQTVTLDQIREAGCIYQTIPEGWAAKLLDTKHPNINAAEFSKWLQTRAAAAFGLPSQYATLAVMGSYSAFRGEVLLAAPVWEEVQHFLEQILDWTFYRWSRWAIKKGIIDDKFEDDFLKSVEWKWPNSQKDSDRMKEQEAWNLGLANGTVTYKQLLGSNWKQQLEQVKQEIEFCEEIGLPHSARKTVSGGYINTKTGQTDPGNDFDDTSTGSTM